MGARSASSAFVYAAGRMIHLDLSDFGAIEAYAVDINEDGQVLGQYLVPVESGSESGPESEEMHVRGFLATPVSPAVAAARQRDQRRSQQ